MTDVDQWIEIAKDCKYLPENDLKVLIIIITFMIFQLKIQTNFYIDIPTPCFFYLETM